MGWLISSACQAPDAARVRPFAFYSAHGRSLVALLGELVLLLSAKRLFSAARTRQSSTKDSAGDGAIWQAGAYASRVGEGGRRPGGYPTAGSSAKSAITGLPVRHAQRRRRAATCDFRSYQNVRGIHRTTRRPSFIWIKTTSISSIIVHVSLKRSVRPASVHLKLSSHAMGVLGAIECARSKTHCDPLPPAKPRRVTRIAPLGQAPPSPHHSPWT